jgi:hypothetical protein
MLCGSLTRVACMLTTFSRVCQEEDFVMLRRKYVIARKYYFICWQFERQKSVACDAIKTPRGVQVAREPRVRLSHIKYMRGVCLASILR